MHRTHDHTAGNGDLVNGVGSVEDAVCCHLRQPFGTEMIIQANALPALLSTNFPVGQYPNVSRWHVNAIEGHGELTIVVHVVHVGEVGAGGDPTDERSNAVVLHG